MFGRTEEILHTLRSVITDHNWPVHVGFAGKDECGVEHELLQWGSQIT